LAEGFVGFISSQAGNSIKCNIKVVC